MSAGPWEITQKSGQQSNSSWESMHLVSSTPRTLFGSNASSLKFETPKYVAAVAKPDSQRSPLSPWTLDYRDTSRHGRFVDSAMPSKNSGSTQDVPADAQPDSRRPSNSEWESKYFDPNRALKSFSLASNSKYGTVTALATDAMPDIWPPLNSQLESGSFQTGPGNFNVPLSPFRTPRLAHDISTGVKPGRQCLPFFPPKPQFNLHELNGDCSTGGANSVQRRRVENTNSPSGTGGQQQPPAVGDMMSGDDCGAKRKWPHAEDRNLQAKSGMMHKWPRFENLNNQTTSGGMCDSPLEHLNDTPVNDTQRKRPPFQGANDHAIGGIKSKWPSVEDAVHSTGGVSRKWQNGATRRVKRKRPSGKNRYWSSSGIMLERPTVFEGDWNSSPAFYNPRREDISSLCGDSSSYNKFDGRRDGTPSAPMDPLPGPTNVWDPRSGLFVWDEPVKLIDPGLGRSPLNQTVPDQTESDRITDRGDDFREHNHVENPGRGGRDRSRSRSALPARNVKSAYFKWRRPRTSVDSPSDDSSNGGGIAPPSPDGQRPQETNNASPPARQSSDHIREAGGSSTEAGKLGTQQTDSPPPAGPDTSIITVDSPSEECDEETEHPVSPQQETKTPPPESPSTNDGVSVGSSNGRSADAAADSPSETLSIITARSSTELNNESAAEHHPGTGETTCVQSTCDWLEEFEVFFSTSPVSSAQENHLTDNSFKARELMHSGCDFPRPLQPADKPQSDGPSSSTSQPADLAHLHGQLISLLRDELLSLTPVQPCCRNLIRIIAALLSVQELSRERLLRIIQVLTDNTSTKE